jgi:hypothetical protein
LLSDGLNEIVIQYVVKKNKCKLRLKRKRMANKTLFSGSSEMQKIKEIEHNMKLIC